LDSLLGVGLTTSAYCKPTVSTVATINAILSISFATV
jgi:hypothetical protein